MIKTFEKYSIEELSASKLNFGQNPTITNSVIFNNPQNITLGNNVRIDHGCLLIAGKDTFINIGDNTHINAYCAIHANNANVTIGKEVDIGIFTVIFTAYYDFTKFFPRQHEHTGPVLIEDNSIIGPSNTILANTTFGKSSAVGTNSFVKNSIPSYTVAGGNPAHFIKNKTDE